MATTAAKKLALSGDVRISFPLQADRTKRNSMAR